MSEVVGVVVAPAVTKPDSAAAPSDAGSHFCRQGEVSCPDAAAATPPPDSHCGSLRAWGPRRGARMIINGRCAAGRWLICSDTSRAQHQVLRLSPRCRGQPWLMLGHVPTVALGPNTISDLAASFAAFETVRRRRSDTLPMRGLAIDVTGKAGEDQGKRASSPGRSAIRMKSTSMSVALRADPIAPRRTNVPPASRRSSRCLRHRQPNRA